MTVSRMTRLLPAVLTAAAALGCGGSPHAASTGPQSPPTSTAAAAARPDPHLAPAPQPQKPDLSRLAFDPGTRTLTVYELPERSARWMLATPAAPAGVPVDREYKFPPDMDLDLDQIGLFYTVPNRRPSPTVSLREIVESRDTQVQR